ncbi:DUF2190 family protein [Paraburkholderia bryophila]|uniref:Putative RecA/RadA family phage recombinase n=1 Tax=Paraburkholderia bryophila TaxID=420952 RepID=A0A7Y9W4L8_9BURK|nr:DUF2190 family protein [Paraburkholderia bryophila]NYH13433.1 putative RecA/RadA family phage recombinase [Paraburkholderia bryophila]
MNNFIQKGNTLTATLAAAVASGQLVLLGNSKLPAVATAAYVANTPGEYALNGVFELPADAPSTGAVGDVAYWDAANSVVTSTAAANAKAGVYAAPKAANDTTARVRLPAAN